MTWIDELHLCWWRCQMTLWCTVYRDTEWLPYSCLIKTPRYYSAARMLVLSEWNICGTVSGERPVRVTLPWASARSQWMLGWSAAQRSGGWWTQLRPSKQRSGGTLQCFTAPDGIISARLNPIIHATGIMSWEREISAQIQAQHCAGSSSVTLMESDALPLRSPVSVCFCSTSCSYTIMRKVWCCLSHWL